MNDATLTKDLNAVQSACGPEKRHLRFRAQVTSVAKAGKKIGVVYYEAEFADAVGTMKLKCWENGASARWCEEQARAMVRAKDSGEDAPPAVEVTGEFSKGDWGVESANWVARPLSEEERAEFFLGSAEFRGKQERDWVDIRRFVSTMIDGHFHRLCERFLEENGAEFRRAAAARGNHHARPGGLVEHVAGMMRAADALARVYQVTLDHRSEIPEGERMKINVDLLLAGVLFHDCGKMWENQYVPDSFEMPYSQVGEMLGHIAMGFELVRNIWQRCEAESIRAAGDAWPGEKLVHLQHLILSHHGEHEWGSPVTPKTYEAMLLHHVDNTDAKMEMLRGAREKGRRIGEGIIEKTFPLGTSVVTPAWAE